MSALYDISVDDIHGKTICAASTLTPDLKESLKALKKSDEAEKE